MHIYTDEYLRRKQLAERVVYDFCAKGKYILDLRCASGCDQAGRSLLARTHARTFWNNCK